MSSDASVLTTMAHVLRMLRRNILQEITVCLGFVVLVGLGWARPSRAAPPRELPLPTGSRLDPAGESFDVGGMPLNATLAPGGKHLLVLLSGWLEQGLQVVDRKSGSVLQTLPQDGAFLGLAFDARQGVLYASGGQSDVVYRYTWNGEAATPAGKIPLTTRDSKLQGARYPAGLALSPDGRVLYVAENMADTLAVIDLHSGKVTQRLAAGHYPYAVAVARGGRVFVSEWGGNHVRAFDPRGHGALRPAWMVEVGRHPSALALNGKGSRLYVAAGSVDRIAVLETGHGARLANLLDPLPSGPGEGSTPNSLALSPTGSRLFVAEADANAVAVFDLSRSTADEATAGGNDRLAGRIPVGWYPTGVLALEDALWVVNGKGAASSPNPKMVQPGQPLDAHDSNYSLGQLRGSLEKISTSRLLNLAFLTHRVAAANGWERVRTKAAYPPFKHVILIIKENRTYDQVLSDLRQGDGDPSLSYFPRAGSPNHHALAERFGLYDRFFTNAEVSEQGHVWSTAAYVTDYGEKNTPSHYSRRRREVEEGEVDEPARGFLWDLAVRKGLTLRVYGEFAQAAKVRPGEAPRYESTKRNLAPYTSPTYPAFDPSIADQRRADVWIQDLHAAEKTGSFPALQIMHLPNDHTAGARPGLPTPRSCMADNDLALGRIVEALSRSAFWHKTVVFVVEDDAQDGPDHVDSHRSVFFAISAYNRPATIHRFVNTTDVLATLEEILGLEPLSMFDYFGNPLREEFAADPDPRPYVALIPSVPLTETNPATGPGALESAGLDLSRPDASDDLLFNHVLWAVLKGEAPYPGPRRLPMLDILR